MEGGEAQCRPTVPVDNAHLILWYDLLSEMAEGGDISYRVDEAKAALVGLGKYLEQLNPKPTDDL
jgi:hypothetical protein